MKSKSSRSRQRKKVEVNITSLCDIQYKVEEQPYRPVIHRNRSYFQRNLLQTKEQFLLGTFTICLNYELKDHVFTEKELKDPDLMLHWKNISYIRVKKYQETLNCPICLQCLMAPRITPCCHTYCWSCLTEYFQINQKTVLKCPVCQDLFELSTVKPLHISNQVNYQIGNEIRLISVCRSKKYHNLLTTNSGKIPCSNNHTVKPNRKNTFPLVGDRDCEFYKYQISTPHDMILLLEDNLSDLELQKKSDPRNPSILEYLTSETLKMIGEQQKLQMRTTEILESIKKEKHGHQRPQIEPNDERESHKTHQHSETSLTKTHEVTVDDRFIFLDRRSSYLYHQSEDGNPIFLCDLIIRMLRSEYGSFGRFPRSIRGKILEIFEYPVTDNTRYHHRSIYGNLPLGCLAKVVEINLDHLLSHEIRKQYVHEVNKRRRKREEVIKKEERERFEIERKQNEEVEKRKSKIKKREEVLHKKYESYFPTVQESVHVHGNPATSPTTTTSRRKNKKRKNRKSKRNQNHQNNNDDNDNNSESATSQNINNPRRKKKNVKLKGEWKIGRKFTKNEKLFGYVNPKKQNSKLLKGAWKSRTGGN